MDQQYINRVLFETGNDVPWETDGIEFVKSDKFTIHRGLCDGLYVYRYDGFICYDNVDAVQLLDWGMAKRKVFSQFCPWDSSCIAIPTEGAAMRDFNDNNMDLGERRYLVWEGKQIYSVNKFYLLAEHLATVADEKLYQCADIPNMSYKNDSDPWKEDKLFFLPNSEYNIRKGRVPGRYLLARKSITRNVSASELLSNGLALPIAQRKAYYFEKYCPTAAIKWPQDMDQFHESFKNLFAKEDMVFKDNFRFTSLLDIAICYDSLKRYVIPGSKKGQIVFPETAPEVAAQYNAFYRLVEQLIQYMDAEKERIEAISQNFIKSIASLQGMWNKLKNTNEYWHWDNQLSLDSQPYFADFYRRTVEKDEAWDILLQKVWKLDDAHQQLKQQLTAAMSAAQDKYQRFWDSYNSVTLPQEGAYKRDFTKKARFSYRFEHHPYIEANLQPLKDAEAALSKLTGSLGDIKSILQENMMIKQRAKHYEKLLRTIESTHGGAHKSIMGKHKPFSASHLRLTRTDYKLTRMADDRRADVDSYSWKMRSCYTLMINNVEEYVFDEVLLYLGLAERK